MKNRNQGTWEPIVSTPDENAIGWGDNNILIRIFFVLFLLTMLCAVAVSVVSMLLHGVFYDLTSTLLYLVVLFFFYIAISKVTSRNQKKMELAMLCCIILGGVILRWTALHFMQTQPISDFSRPHQFYRYYNSHGPYLEKVPWAQRDVHQLYYSAAPAWFPYMRLVMIIYDLLGERLLWIQIMDMILAGGTILLIYLVLPNKKAALMGAALFAFNPSMIIYSSITTPDHITAFLFVLTIFFWMRGEKYRTAWPRSKKVIPYAVGVIICCVLINWFKPLSVLFSIAFICYECAIYLYPAMRRRISLKELWKEIISYELGFIIVLFGGLTVANSVLNAQVESMMKTDVVNSTGLYLLWGASLDENKVYNPDLVTNEFKDMLERYNGDYDKIFSEINKLLPERLKVYIEHPFLLLGQKFSVIFWREEGYFDFSNTSPAEEYAQSVDELLRVPTASVMLAHMRLLYLLSALSAVYFLFSRKVDKTVFLTAIVIFGYTLVLLFGGVQTRYKSVVVALWCIIAGYALCEIIPVLQKGYQNLRKIRNLRND